MQAISSQVQKIQKDVYLVSGSNNLDCNECNENLFTYVFLQ